MVLIFFTLIANNIDYLFIYLFAICIFSKVKCLMSSTHFLIASLVFHYNILKHLYAFQI